MRCRRRPSASTATVISARHRLLARLLRRLFHSGIALDENHRADLPGTRASSDEMDRTDESAAGLCLINDPARRSLYMFNHIEYDTTSLADEYWRDTTAGKKIELPANYFPKDDPKLPPEKTAGEATRICCSATGLTSSTRPRPSILPDRHAPA